jgi:hypothetical protein
MTRAPIHEERTGEGALLRACRAARGLATARDERTLPLFPLWLILDADGTLARECRSIVERTQA